MGTRTEVLSLFMLGGGQGSRIWIATRAALSLGVPLALSTAVGHQTIGLQVSVGAFTALFATSRTAAERAKVLPFIGAGLLASAGLGVVLAQWGWALTLGLVLIAAVSCALAFGYRVGPPGPVFFVLAYGLAGNITAPVDGVRHIDPWAFVLAVCCGIAFSYLVALVPLLSARERARPVSPLRELLPGPRLGREGRLLIVRAVLVAAIGAVVSAVWLDPHRAYWTVSSGVAVIGLTTGRSYAFRRALHRIAGTLVGALVYLVVAPLGEVPWALVALLVLLQFSVELVITRNYGFGLALVTPLVLLIVGVVTGGSDHQDVVLARLVDTATGALLGFASGFLHPRSRA
ncbi:MAG: FUSC family protein [Leucobacter sp.]